MQGIHKNKISKRLNELSQHILTPKISDVVPFSTTPTNQTRLVIIACIVWGAWSSFRGTAVMAWASYELVFAIFIHKTVNVSSTKKFITTSGTWWEGSTVGRDIEKVTQV